MSERLIAAALAELAHEQRQLAAVVGTLWGEQALASGEPMG